MANYRKLTRADLVAFIINMATQIANGKVSGLLAAQNTALSDALTDIAAELSAADTNIVSTRAAAQEATALGQLKTKEAQDKCGDVVATLKSVNATADEYEALGLDAPDTIRTPVVPNAPTTLAATNPGSGFIQLKWKGNNPGHRVTFAIYVKIGDTAPWTLLATSTSRSFLHEGVDAGQYYEYRVRAEAGRNNYSMWSNNAVAYGT
jgi:hypothetical protein